MGKEDNSVANQANPGESHIDDVDVSEVAKDSPIEDMGNDIELNEESSEGASSDSITIKEEANAEEEEPMTRASNKNSNRKERTNNRRKKNAPCSSKEEEEENTNQEEKQGEEQDMTDKRSYATNLKGRKKYIKRVRAEANEETKVTIPTINKDGNRELKVSSQSNPRNLAGCIAKSVREGVLPSLVAVGDLSINQGVKAFAIARSYLEEDQTDICLQPEVFESRQFNVNVMVSMHTYEAHRRNAMQNTSVAKVQQEIKVSANGTISSIAGAIASRARSGERICMTAIGPGSVSVAIKSIALARKYLNDDSLEIFCKPEFDHVAIEGGSQLSSVRLSLLIVQT